MKAGSQNPIPAALLCILQYIVLELEEGYGYQVVYLVIVVSLGVLAVVVSLWDKFGTPRYRPLRASRKYKDTLLERPAVLRGLGSTFFFFLFDLATALFCRLKF